MRGLHADTRNQTLTNILEILKLAENRYSGIPTIRLEMKSANLPAPNFENKRGTFVVTLENGRGIDNSIVKSGDIKTDLLRFCKTPRTREEIVGFVELTQYYAMKTLVMPLVEESKLKMTIPDKPKSRNQKYVAIES